MLNKLLKRCMPWMDKGRWYCVDATDLDNIKHDTLFSTVNYEDGVLAGTIPFNRMRKYQLIDVKFVGSYGRNSIGNQIEVKDEINAGALEIKIPGPGIVWLFVKLG